jgi:hypothetical protein
MKELINNIRIGKTDINNQELFFSVIMKGLILQLQDDINIRGIKVPHMIMHTGDDLMYLEKRGYDASQEPLEITNEDNIYSVVPRCMITPGGINIVADQLTNPYTIGNFQFETDDNLIDISAEFRRLPIKLDINLKYLTSTYRDLLEVTQQILTKLAFIRTYTVVYMGQQICCSYRLPDAFSGEYLTDLEGNTMESKNKTLEISLEIETNLPVISAPTVMLSSERITKYNYNNNIK